MWPYEVSSFWNDTYRTHTWTNCLWLLLWFKHKNVEWTPLQLQQLQNKIEYSYIFLSIRIPTTWHCPFTFISVVKKHCHYWTPSSACRHSIWRRTLLVWYTTSNRLTLPAYQLTRNPLCCNNLYLRRFPSTRVNRKGGTGLETDCLNSLFPKSRVTWLK